MRTVSISTATICSERGLLLLLLLLGAQQYIHTINGQLSAAFFQIKRSARERARAPFVEMFKRKRNEQKKKKVSKNPIFLLLFKDKLDRMCDCAKVFSTLSDWK